jgi:hypothetical protein
MARQHTTNDENHAQRYLDGSLAGSLRDSGEPRLFDPAEIYKPQ